MSYDNENQREREDGPGMSPESPGRREGEPVVVAEQPATPADPTPSESGWTQPQAAPPEPPYTQSVPPLGEPAWNSGSSRQGGQGDLGLESQPGQPSYSQTAEPAQQPGYTQTRGENHPQTGGENHPQNSGENYTQNSGENYTQTGGQNYAQSSGQGYTQGGAQGDGQSPQNNPAYYPNASQEGNYQNQGQYQTQYQAHYQTQYQNQGDRQNGMAVAALVMGILSLVACCCGWIGIVLGVLGIVFALMSRNDQQPMNGQAKAGLIMSCIGIGLNVICIILLVVFQFSALLPEIMNY